MESKDLKRETYRGYITSWETSGKSQKEYCTLNSINYQTFLYYRKHLVEAANSSFKEIKLPVMLKGNILYSIEFPNKCVIRIHEPVGTDFLSALANSCK